MRPRALLLDLGDTVFGLDRFPAERVQQELARLLAADRLFPGESVERAQQLMDGFGRRMAEGYARGDLVERHPSALMLEEFAVLGVAPPTEVAERIDAAFGAADVARFRAPGDPPARLGWMRDAGLAVVAVSNTTTAPELLRGFLAEAGILDFFDGFVFSIEAGVRKPHERVYRQALEIAGITPGEAVFVGDRVAQDVRGPGALGIPAILTHEFRQEDPGDAEPLHVITELAELRRVLGFD